MKRFLLVASLVCGFAALPMLAQPEGEKQTTESKSGEKEVSPIWAWLNFLMLAGGLGYLVKKNAGPYFAQRSLEIRKGMVDADAARTEADAKVADVDARLARLPGEIEALKQEAKHEAEAETARARKEAADELAKIEAHLADEITAAGKAARLELRRYSASVAIALAEKKIAARMSPGIQDKLVNGFARHLAQPPSQAGNN